MTTLTCDLAPTDTARGGESEQEVQAGIVVTENGFALKSRACRDWLREMISDPDSEAIDRSAFVQKAEVELSISRRNALALHRLFCYSDTVAVQQALSQYQDGE